jgi:Xaa-Pro dipeptidase
MAAAAGMLGLRLSALRAQSSRPTLLPPLASPIPDIPLPPPITRAERLARIAKAQQLLQAERLQALLIEAGSSLVYFTGVRWSRSERLTAAVIPAEGGVDARADAGVVRACRAIKSPAEIALMQAASDVTVAAYRETLSQIALGMTPEDIGTLMSAAMAKRGGAPEFTLILLGEASAYPHGSAKPQQVRSGEVVLMDCGCTVQGYQSDISRTLVMGEATKQQRDVWNLVRRGQQIAFETARVGTPAGAVDDAVRAAYEKAGFGPGYELPGTSHRTGHGIGMDGHEPVNLVHGETTPLAPGMCFSDEPGIYIPGRFGVRLEDCVYMTENGPRWFSAPASSLETPFG